MPDDCGSMPVSPQHQTIWGYHAHANPCSDGPFPINTGLGVAVQDLFMQVVSQEQTPHI